jgi:hypothetical protein
MRQHGYAEELQTQHSKHCNFQHTLVTFTAALSLFCRSIPNAEYMRQHGYAEEMLNGLLNLDLALECDGFVSSIASNWARWGVCY